MLSRSQFLPLSSLSLFTFTLFYLRNMNPVKRLCFIRDHRSLSRTSLDLPGPPRQLPTFDSSPPPLRCWVSPDRFARLHPSRPETAPIRMLNTNCVVEKRAATGTFLSFASSSPPRFPSIAELEPSSVEVPLIDDSKVFAF